MYFVPILILPSNYQVLQYYTSLALALTSNFCAFICNAADFIIVIISSTFDIHVGIFHNQYSALIFIWMPSDPIKISIFFAKIGTYKSIPLIVGESIGPKKFLFWPSLNVAMRLWAFNISKKIFRPIAWV